MSAALTAVDARRATARGLQNLASTIDRETRVWAVAAGKAAVGMARAVDESLGGRLVAGVMTADADVEDHPAWQVYPATHPRPSPASESAGRAALALADAVSREGGLLLVCLSGGASAMLAVPSAGLTIADKTATTDRLLRAGLDIGELNMIRRHLSAIKGGQLAARAGRTITLAISDVCTPVEDDPKVIGSGPTAGDDSTFAEALEVIERHGLAGELPTPVMAHLYAGRAGTTGGPVRSDSTRLAASAYWIVASRHDAMRAAGDTARRLGYRVHVETAPTIGEARGAAARVMSMARTLERPACLIASGETTVRVSGTGRGGRNQEFAVAALEPLASLMPAGLASIGTDGRDGPTDAAGAFVDDGMWGSLGLDARALVAQVLGNNDSYSFLNDRDAVVRTGPTGTNVGDLQVVILR